MKKQISIILTVLVTLVVLALFVFPVLIAHWTRTPSWSEDGGTFLHDVGKAMRQYSQTHRGEMPPSLASLHPEYIQDKRVLGQTAMFGHQKTMAVIYWRPLRLGNGRVAVAQLVLNPEIETNYAWRSVGLWGDGRVRLQKI